MAIVVNATAAGKTDEAGGVNFDADNVEFDITYGQVHVTAVAAAGNHPELGLNLPSYFDNVLLNDII